MSQLWNAQQLGPGQPKIKVDDYALRFPTNTQDVARVCSDIAKLYLDPENRSVVNMIHHFILKGFCELI